MLVTTEFVGADLTGADLSSSVLTNANLTGANLTNAFLGDAVDVQTAVFTSTTIYNQWTRFPDAFDPMTHGLTLSPSALGDVNANDAYDVADLDMLTSRLGGRGIGPRWLPDAAFDLNNDTNIDLEDHRIWVQDLKHTWFGDADLNGLFDSADYVQVFVAGRYRTGQIAGWAEGDWDGDGLFDSGDFVIAFVDGGYEQGPRGSLAAVPEPATPALIWVGMSLLALRVGFRRCWYWMGAVGVLVAIGVGDGTSSALGAVLFEDHFTEGMSPEWVSVKPVQWVEDGWLMTQADGRRWQGIVGFCSRRRSDMDRLPTERLGGSHPELGQPGARGRVLSNIEHRALGLQRPRRLLSSACHVSPGRGKPSVAETLSNERRPLSASRRCHSIF